MTTTTGSTDQAFTLPFRLTLVVQAVAALVFGLAPIALLSTYAPAIGFSGTDPLIYRLGGAATIGYLVAPVVALAARDGWRHLRIPAIATLTFTLGALAASLWEFGRGGRQPVIVAVIVAGAAFSLVAAYWLRRDKGPAINPGRPLGTPARAVLALAVVSAGTFGLLPLLVPGLFASVFGLIGANAWVYRVAGAACLGYATAGIASLMAPGYSPIRLQNMAAIAFNAVGAASAWRAIFVGGGGLLAPIVAAAATFFTVALVWIDRKYAA